MGLGEETVDEGGRAGSVLRGTRSQHDDDGGTGGSGGEQAVRATAERSGHFSGGDACLWLWRAGVGVVVWYLLHLK